MDAWRGGGGRGRWRWSAAGAAFAAGAVGVHVAAGLGLPSDAARALSVQLPITAIGLLLALHRPGNRLGPLALAAAGLVGLSMLAVAILRTAAAGNEVPDILERAAFGGQGRC